MAQPAIVDSYVMSTIQYYDFLIYRPRQVANDLDIDNWDAQTAKITNPGRYAGWDVMVTPNHSIVRDQRVDNWITVRLNRTATVAVVWRWGGETPSWLNSWTPSDPIYTNNSANRVFTKVLPAGDHVFPGNTYGLRSPSGRNTYVLMFAEANGTPTPAPAVPSGKETPRPNQTCQAWVHDQYVAPGPDGRTYPTWHAQIDPVYWCYFQHEHGSNPTFVDEEFKPLYGYTASKAGRTEPHVGYKGYAFEGDKGTRWYITQHFGTGSTNRACAQFHTMDVVVADASGTMKADLRVLGDYGKSVVNAGDAPLTPPGCPDQARDAGDSTGLRKLPTKDTGSIGYEPWRVAGEHLPLLGLIPSDFTINTHDPIVICNTATCDQAITSSNSGTLRVIQAANQMKIVAGTQSGVFYTDPRGQQLRGSGDTDAVRQYHAAGFAATSTALGGKCRDVEGFGRPLRCNIGNMATAPTERENSIRHPN